MSDPWKHRSSGMKCQTCMWFVVKVKTELSLVRCTCDAKLSSDHVIQQMHRADCHITLNGCDGEPAPAPVTATEFVKQHKPSVGRCRRHAPVMNGYPVVFKHDWCGDFKLDEEKA